MWLVMDERRGVVLRSERDGRDSRHLSAYIDESGDLHIDGQDLGPGTAPMSGDGEYEWFQTVRAEYLPRLLEVLGADPDADVLTFLQDNFAGAASRRLEPLIRASDVPMEFGSWSG